MAIRSNSKIMNDFLEYIGNAGEFANKAKLNELS